MTVRWRGRVRYSPWAEGVATLARRCAFSAMTPDRLRPWAAGGALFGAAAIILQFALSLQPHVAKGASLGFSLASFHGYFTILTNIGCTLVFAARAAGGDGGFWRFFRRPGVLTALASAILIVGAV